VGEGGVADDVGDRCWGHRGYVEFEEDRCVEVGKKGLDEGVGKAGLVTSWRGEELTASTKDRLHSAGRASSTCGRR